jgi:FlgD Ig-like domain
VRSIGTTAGSAPGSAFWLQLQLLILSLATAYVPATGFTQSYSLPLYPDTMNASCIINGSTAVNYASGGATVSVTAPAGASYPSPHLTASDGVLWVGSNAVAYAASPSAAPSSWTHIDGLIGHSGYGGAFVATQTTFLYTVVDGSGLHLCSRPLSNLSATPTCALADSGDFGVSWPTIRLQDSTALITATKTVNGVRQNVAFLWNGSSAISVQLGSLSAVNAFRGDTPYLLVRDADQIPSVVKVNSNGTLGSPLPTVPTTTVGPLSMAVTPDRVVAGDGRDASGYLAVWSRSVTASGFGSENLLPRRASDFAASAGRTAVAGMDGLSVYDRGTLQNTFVDSHLVDVSGPFVAKPDDSGTQAEIYTAKGVKVATFPGVDGLLFGSEYVTYTTDADTSGSMHVTVNHVVGGAAPTTVDLPAGTASCELQRVWNDLGALWCDYGQSIQIYNLRTGHLVKSHLPSTGGSLYLAGLGDGYAIITDLDVHYTRVHFMWDLSKDTVTTIPECTWHDPVTDGVGHVACASDTELIWRDYSSTLSMSAPRFLGALADGSADFSKVGSTWSVDLDTTKALKAGTMVISNASGTVVRTLSTPASSDGSIRGVTWNGLDASGRGAPIGTYTYKLLADATDGFGTVASVDGTAPATGTVTITAASTMGMTSGGMVSLSPARVLDTRSNGGKLGAGESRSVQVTGVGGVPASGVSAVVLNVTVTETTAGGYLTVSPTGTARPTASNLNWSSGGTTIPNAVTVKVGTGGKVDLYQSGPGTAQVIVDVAGYYLDGTVTEPGGFSSLTPARILDTRSNGGALAAAESRDLQVTGAGGVPSTNVSAVVLNVTVTATTASGYLSVYPAGTAKPTASNLNWNGPGTTIPNQVVVKIGDSGKISLFQSGPGTAQVIADVAGYFLGGTATKPGMFVALSPPGSSTPAAPARSAAARMRPWRSSARAAYPPPASPRSWSTPPSPRPPPAAISPSTPGQARCPPPPT